MENHKELVISGDVVFIADIHFGISKEIDARFLNFIKRLPESITIISLGDFVDFWAEGNNYDFSADYRNLSLLQKKKIFFLRGNRDFLIGDRWSKLTGGKILAEPAVINCSRNKIIAMHGDLLMTSDLRYLFWRSICRSRLFHFAAKSIGRKWAMKVARYLRIASSKEVARKSKKELSIDYSLAEKLMEEDGIIVCGHTHRSERKKLDCGELIVLGSWDKDGKVLFVGKDGLLFEQPDDIKFM